MKLKIPRGTKPTVTIDGITEVDIVHDRVVVVLEPPLTPEEAQPLIDAGFVFWGPDVSTLAQMTISPALWSRVEVIQ